MWSRSQFCRLQPVTIVFLFSAMVTLLLSSRPTHAQQITTFEVPRSICVQVAGINNGSTVAGSYEDGPLTYHGFIRDSSGTLTVFDAPDAEIGSGLGTHITAINDAGETTGWFDQAGPQGPIVRGFIRDSSGNLTIFDVDRGLTVATGLNASGQTSGSAYAPNGFQRDATGNVALFALPQSAGTSVAGINASGAIAGFFFVKSANTNRGFVRNKSGFIKIFDVPDASGINGTWPTAINDHNVVAGWYQGKEGGNHGFVRDQTGNITMFDPPGASYSMACGINKSGTIVGYYTSLDTVQSYRSYTRSSTGVFTTFAAPLASYGGTRAMAINDLGQTAGVYLDAATKYHGFIGNPK